MTAPGPFRTAPIFKTKAWGSGRRMRDVLGLAAPEGAGEAWLVSDVEGDPSRILDGPWAGRSLREVVREHPAEVLGPRADPDRFPLLVKFLEIESPLSVQVHPDGPTAAALGDGERGKCEAWFILDVGPEGAVWLGLRDPIDPDELPRLSRDGGLAERLDRFRPEPGEGLEILPGTLHTGRDLLLLEVQETSDVTYRVHDWGRDRALHLEQAAECLRRIPREAPPRRERLRAGRTAVTGAAPFDFTVEDLPAGGATRLDGEHARIAVGLRGAADLDAGGGAPLRLGPGQAAVVPAATPRARVTSEGGARIAWAGPA